MIDYNEWKEDSLKGLRCAVPACYNEPTNQCPKCSIFYCYAHGNIHFHIDRPRDARRRKHDTEKLR